MRFAIKTILTALVLGSIAPPSSAERDLVPSMVQDFDVCPGRPSEPEWMQQIPLREAYQRVLVQDIYRAQNLARVVKTETCDCATRFPGWGQAESTFRESHADEERWEMLQASDAYNRHANELRPRAPAICDAVGNW